MENNLLFPLSVAEARQASIPFELASLSRAYKYQRWVFDLLSPYLGNRILEFGAGLGNLSRWLPLRERLILTEVDPFLMSLLMENTQELRQNDPRISVQAFDLLKDSSEAFKKENLDTLISFNVLEHVEDDRGAFERQCEILRASTAPGPKRLICFVPAHPFCYGEMDKTFGHFRRYSARAIRDFAGTLAPEARLTLRHFNIPGMLGWLLQGRVMRRTSFGMSSVTAFEALCPFIRPFDDFLHETLRLPLGQSLMAVLEWPEQR